MQRLEAKPTASRLLILDPTGLILHYRPDGRGDRLGPLEKRILPLLLQGPLHGAEIARRLHIWHNHAHVAMRRLAGKGMVESWTILGENLAGTQILRRFYALDPANVSIAVPVKRMTEREIQAAKEKAQAYAIGRELEGIRLQCQLSLKPSTRLKASIDRSP